MQAIINSIDAKISTFDHDKDIMDIFYEYNSQNVLNKNLVELFSWKTISKKNR